MCNFKLRLALLAIYTKQIEQLNKTLKELYDKGKVNGNKKHEIILKRIINLNKLF